jgi:hypothetical protein
MTTDPKTMKRLKAAAAKAAEFAAAAKEGVREAKAKLKHARKSFKAAKKVAKQARRKIDEAAAVPARPAPKAKSPSKLKFPSKTQSAAKPRPTVKPTGMPQGGPKEDVRSGSSAAKPKRRLKRVTKSDALEPPETMRSAAEVAKSVIERLHSPPPLLPPMPAIPSPEPSSRRGRDDAGEEHRDQDAQEQG